MNTGIKIVFAIGITGLLWACGNPGSGPGDKDNNALTETNNAVRDETDVSREDSIALAHDQTETIELDNGNKWLINDEMKPHIAEGEAAVNDYIAENRTDYKALADTLKNIDNALISSCTMEGKSHDELHKWLHPHLELVAELKDAKNEEEANKIIGKIDASYDTFWVYFQ